MTSLFPMKYVIIDDVIFPGKQTFVIDPSNEWLAPFFATNHTKGKNKQTKEQINHTKPQK